MVASPYSLEGARRVLIGSDDRLLQAVDSVLGLAILASGPVALATGAPALFAAWGWVDQKSQLVDLLGRMTAIGRDRLTGGRNRERMEVLAATHTVLTYGAFFEALRAVLGPVHDSLAMTDEDRRRLTTTAKPTGGAALVERISTSSVNLPWAGCGFTVNRDATVAPLYRELALHCIEFFENFDVWKRGGSVRVTDPIVSDIVDRALEKYESEYKRLAADVREFEIWAMLGEHEATQKEVGVANRALLRLEDLMVSLAGAMSGSGDRARLVNADFNRAVLTEAMVATQGEGDLSGLAVPEVGDGYVSPSFRWAVMDTEAKPANEGWWQSAPLEHDLDGFLAAYFSSPQSCERPLIVLGHPGSGKSMFTKVCAARLSASEAFTAARVPLRQVADAAAPIYQQVSSVLSKVTNGRVLWTELTEAAGNTTRVLFIDGLDELMQATGATESNYLHNVAEFQRVERITSGPVSVVVTSRTLVADIAHIPQGCLILKLEDFSREQVRSWLAVWERTNRAALPPAEAVLAYGAVARQPLLLLLLVIFSASNGLPRVRGGSTSAKLYDGLLRTFISREIDKSADPSTDRSRDERMAQELWRLGITAFSMFNRGKHFVDEQTLLEDLRVLDPSHREKVRGNLGRPLGGARRTVGRFFFIQAAEADEGLEGRSYEFLHSTFSEYLIAYFAMGEIAELWDTRARPSSQRWDDDRLFALLSHQLCNAGGSAILTFFRQLHSASSPARRRGILEMLRALVREAEERWDSGRFGAYSPSAGTYLQRFSVYTANIVMLLVHLEDGPIPLSTLAPEGADPVRWWSRLLHSWQGCIDTTPFRNFAELIEPLRLPEPAIARRTGDPRRQQSSVHHLALAFDERDAAVMNAGIGVVGNDIAVHRSDDVVSIAGRIARFFADPIDAVDDVDDLRSAVRRATLASGAPGYSGLDLGGLLLSFITRFPELWSYGEVHEFVGESRLGEDTRNDWLRALLIAQYPALLAEFPDFLQPAYYVPGFLPQSAPLIAGSLVWQGDEASALAAVITVPDSLREKCAGLRRQAQTLRHSMDRRRLVSLLADYLLHDAIAAAARPGETRRGT